MSLEGISPWPHQARGVQDVINELSVGTRRVCVTCPTGGGKSLMMAMLVQKYLPFGVTLFTNRKLLMEQMAKGMARYGFEFGKRAAGHAEDLYADFQITSIQTEYSRVVKRGAREPHRSRLLLVDEAHLNNTKQANAVFRAYREAHGSAVVGFTATPIGLDGAYDKLIVAGTTSQLRECGALVPAVMYGCDEPDQRNIRRVPVGEDPSEAEAVKLIMVPGIHGRVIDWFRRLNPHMEPAIGFAPGVPESVGFAEAFEAAGIPAAHIDGDRVWVRGAERASTQALRDELLEMSRAGEVRIVWNRFVLREAIDMPWLKHGVFATVYGATQSYLQSGGRLLRAYPATGKRQVTVQDHGGNWWRHGSLNADRVWRLTDTANSVAHEHLDAVTGDGENPPKDPEPFLCPACKAVIALRRVTNDDLVAVCPLCFHRIDFKRRSRPVIQSDGELVEHEGSPFRARRVERRPDTADKWKQIYFRAKNSKNMTFNAAAGLFCHEHGYFPPRSLPLMPLSSWEWYLPVSKVPFKNLRGKE